MAARRNGRRLGGEGGDTYIYYPEIVLEVLTKTGDYNVQKSDSGKILVMNSGAEKDFVLPSVDASDLGLTFTFVTIGAGKTIIDPADADVIDDSTATTGNISATAAAGVVPTITIQLVSATQWAIQAANGTWTTT
jgi:hypothetical protein